MKTALKKKYSAPSIELIAYEEVLDKTGAETRREAPHDRLPVMVFYAVLLALPSLVIVSAVDPSGFMVYKVLAGPPPLLWSVWAIAAFGISLGNEKLLRKMGRTSPVNNNRHAVFFVLGLLNCLAVVALLWLAGGAS
jgi:hypothetical protein